MHQQVPIILVNLRVPRFLTHGEKVPFENFLKFYFGLKHPKLTTPQQCGGTRRVGQGGGKGGCAVVSALVLKSMCPFTSQKCRFIPRIASVIFKYHPFVSWNCPFVFKKYLHISQKCSIVFQNCPLVFQKCLLFIYWARLFQGMPFFLVIEISPCNAPSCSER